MASWALLRNFDIKQYHILLLSKWIYDSAETSKLASVWLTQLISWLKVLTFYMFSWLSTRLTSYMID